jgi:hypothetical protein
MSMTYGFRVALFAAGLWVAALPSSQAQTEVLATPYRWLIDPEFNPAKGQFTWVDAATGSIWVSGIDRATGNFIPANGKGVLIERSAAPIGGMGFTLNGPEWALGTPSDVIVYTRFPPGLPPTPENALIGMATQTPSGAWTRKTAAPGPRNAPFGSLSRNDVAKVTYNDAAGNHYWRNASDANSEEALPGLTGTGLLPAVRFVADENIVVYPLTVDGVPQVFGYNLDTKLFLQLTNEPGTKDQPWMWRAPELNGQLVLITTIDKNTVTVYRQGGDGNGNLVWKAASRIVAPHNGSWFSTEPFVYQGRSYAIAQLTEAGADYPSSIWLMNFDQHHPILRRLTPELPDRARADPEIFVTDKGPVVFFSRFDRSKGPYWLCLPCMEGAYRVDTGLPPPH